MRNATLMAVAPNANIGLVVGTTPGIDPRFAQVFSRNKISGKYLDLNHNLVKDLKNMGIWEKTRDAIIENQGDISNIAAIPEHIKNIYKTSFTTSPYAYVEVAARAQKWVDQALSRNMYLETRDIDETMDIYSAAWKKGLKSTYYLHMKPRHTAEQSTVKINKGEKMGKRGFAAVATVATHEALAVSEKSDGGMATSIPDPVDVVLEVPVVAPVQASIEQASVDTAVQEEKVIVQKPKFVPLSELVVETVSVAPATVFAGEVDATVSSEEVHASQVAHGPFAKVSAPKMKVCPIDPAERAQCDSCQ